MGDGEKEDAERKSLAEVFVLCHGGQDLLAAAGAAGVVSFDRLLGDVALMTDAERLEQAVKSARHGESGMAGLRFGDLRVEKTILGFSDGSAVSIGSDGIGVGEWPSPEALSGFRMVSTGSWGAMSRVDSEGATRVGSDLRGGKYGCANYLFAELCLRQAEAYLGVVRGLSGKKGVQTKV